MIPSVKTLERAWPGKGKELRKALEANREELVERYELPSPYAYKGGGYSLTDVRLEACNRIINGFGVEAITRDPYAYPVELICTYVNTGDTYSATIACVRGNYRVTCWGDVVQAYEKRHGAIS